MSEKHIAIRSARATGRAKLNLSFRILGIMGDGYHRVETVLQSVDLEDSITISVTDDTAGGKISFGRIDSKVPGDFPMDGSNLIARAVDAYMKEVPESGKLSLKADIVKEIPIGAGMAGGSADAAATLVALDRIMGDRLGTDRLMELGSRLGADVPFAILGGTCLGTHRGDHLENIEHSHKLFFLIVKPRNLSISTPGLYKSYDDFVTGDQESISPVVPAGKLAESLRDGNLEELVERVGNDFEPVLFNLHPELAGLRDRMLELGCFTANVTGSGPTLFGLVASREHGRYIKRMLASDPLRKDRQDAPYYRFGRLDVFVAESRERGTTVD
ncbi:MAG: 4-(cytidine 5'-diphospho)-2-C-methyl-D-erythritol kinase [Cyanobacteria bacterium HKST-UBA02]|nr:4-(cytidine 5'-diphospho)-2-C-methyl-D-erythritol kinase [Cyanobacteria bacterium HKST-UBA02]